MIGNLVTMKISNQNISRTEGTTWIDVRRTNMVVRSSRGCTGTFRSVPEWNKPRHTKRNSLEVIRKVSERFRSRNGSRKWRKVLQDCGKGFGCTGKASGARKNIGSAEKHRKCERWPEVREDEREVGKNVGQKGKDIGSFGGSGYRSEDVTGCDRDGL